MIAQLIPALLVIGAIVFVIKVISSLGSPRRSSMENRYKNVVKPTHQKAAKQRAENRHNAVLEGIRNHWGTRIDKHDKRAARASTSAGRRLMQGKNPTRQMQQAQKHDRHASGLRALMNAELRWTNSLHNSARSGNPRAQGLVGRVHPGTGHTVGGAGRSGHKPAHHMPNIRQPRQKKTGTASKLIKKALWGK